MTKKKKQPDPSDPLLVAFREWRYAVDRVASVEQQMEQLETALNRDKADMKVAHHRLADLLIDTCLIVNGVAYTGFSGQVVDLPAIIISEGRQ